MDAAASVSPPAASPAAATLAQAPGAPDAPSVAALLVAEATGKSSVVWVTPQGADRPHLLWHIWHEGTAYVLTGAGEQADPGLRDGGAATVIVRSKDTGARAVTWPATVARVETNGPGWTAVMPLLLGARLNLVDGEAAADRWAADGAVLWALTPAGAPSETAERPVEDDRRAGVAPTGNTTAVPRPFTIRFWPRRKR